MTVQKENYYTELLSELKSLIKKEDFEKARAQISDELSLPYVPMWFEKELEILWDEIELKSPTKQEPIQISLEKIIDLLLNSKVEKSSKVGLIDLLTVYNIEKIKPYFKELFNSPMELFIKRRLVEEFNEHIPPTLKIKLNNNKSITISDLILKVDDTKKYNTLQQKITNLLISREVEYEFVDDLLKGIYLNSLVINEDISDLSLHIAILILRHNQNEKEVEDLLNTSKDPNLKKGFEKLSKILAL